MIRGVPSRLHVVMALCGILTLSGCTDKERNGPSSDDVDTGEPSIPSHSGRVQGRICHTSGTTWLSGAMVYTHIADERGTLVDTKIAYTDENGRFELDGLATKQPLVIYAQYGDSVLWTETVEIVSAEEVYVFAEPTCLNPAGIHLAVVSGSRDFSPALHAIGITAFDTIDGQDAATLAAFLLDREAMGTYNLIVLDAGHLESGILYGGETASKDGESDTGSPPDTGSADTGSADTGSEDTGSTDTGSEDTGSADTGSEDTGSTDTGSEDTGEPETPTVYDTEQIIENLRDYVQDGGTIYGIEWAYDAVEISFPDAIEFMNDDGTPDAAQVGLVCDTDATVLDPDLEAWIGKSDIDISYPIPEWPIIESVNGTIHMAGTAQVSTDDGELSRTDTPLLVSFEYGEGQVAVFTFRLSADSNEDVQATLQYMMIQAQD